MEDATGQIKKLRDEYVIQHFTAPTEVYITEEAERALFLEKIEKETYFFSKLVDLRVYNTLFDMRIIWDSDNLRVA